MDINLEELCFSSTGGEDLSGAKKEEKWDPDARELGSVDKGISNWSSTLR